MTNADDFNAISEAFNRHDWRSTCELANKLLIGLPNHPLLRYLAGVAEMELHRMPMALTHLHVASELAPARADFATQFAKALALVKMNREAREVATRALSLSPVDPATLSTLGVILTQTHAHALAATAFRQAARQRPGLAADHFNLATALVAIGEISEAEAELSACIELDPHLWKAHLTLAQLRRWTPNTNHIERMTSLLAGNDDNQEAGTYLHMALAKEQEDCANYSSAFNHYTAGKHAAGHGRNYCIQQDVALFDEIIDAFPEPITTISGCLSKEPIFIIGMPRTGTTLVERIISSHPNVYSAGELMNFGVALKRASGSKTELLLDHDTINRLSHIDFAALGRSYIESTRPATGHRLRFIDKLPHNFLYAAWIAKALPNAKLICLRRDPLDTCLSNFRQLFATHSPYYSYSFDLADTGKYFALFDRLIGHWRHVLPGRVLEVRYEDLVANLEGVTRQLLHFCQLSWNDACLQFERNAAPVNTASAVQVRQPVYRTALGRWRKYAPQLAELRDQLEHEGIAVPH